MIPNTILFCPKCKSEKITTTRLTPMQAVMVSIDDLAIYDAVQVMPLVLHTSAWRASCDECGYFVDYQSY